MRHPTRSLRVSALLATVIGLISITPRVAVAQGVASTSSFDAAQSAVGDRNAVGVQLSWDAGTIAGVRRQRYSTSGGTRGDNPGTNGGMKPAAATFSGVTLSRSFTDAAAPPQSAPASPCPCSLWNPLTTPPTHDDGDESAVELGVRFRSDIAGYVTGVRFYKFAANTGLHVGNLWTANGTLLARASFAGETATGWQQVTFSPAVLITANTTYVASYHTDTGHYASTDGFFNTGVDNAPLHALRDGADGPNGVYRYGPTAFPNQTFQAANYWVDPVFSPIVGSDLTAPTVRTVTPSSGATGVTSMTVVTATLSEMPLPSSVNPTTFELRDPAGLLVPATVYAGGETPTLVLIPVATLAPGTTYRATVKGGPSGVRDEAGNALIGDYSWSFTTVGMPPAPRTCPCSIWNPSITPASVDSDPNAVELGVRFRSDTAGYITGVRFYKFPANTGVHLGSLWSNAGTRLASAPFTAESSAGWQQVNFPTPVAIAANTTYVASYHTTTGNYAADSNYFVAGFDNAPLHALRDGADGRNGVYNYGSSSTFPEYTYRAANYWVDVVFATVLGPDVTPPTVTGVTPSAGATGITTTRVIGANFSEMLAPASVNSTTFELRDPSGAAVPATVSVGGETGTASLTPAAPLAYATTYTGIVKGGPNGVKDVAGNPMSANYTWSFTTVGPPPPAGACPCSLWNSATTPAGFGVDGNAVELGVKFQASVDGYITALRFYKYPGNTGPHVGELWTINGSRLATAPFVNETTMGWQQVTLSPPVPITAGTTYVAAYHTSVGYYAVNENYFGAAVNNTPLRALANSEGGNGVYRYGASGSFPNQTYRASNYWVDAVFVTSLPDTTAPTRMAWGPGGGGAPLSVNVTVQFTEPMDPATINTGTFELRDPSNATVPATVTYNGMTRTATLDPLGALAYLKTYTVIVRGGTSGPRVMDLAGNALAVSASWQFTTTAAPTAAQGPGGPILVVTSASSPYSRYYAEILRAEGLNEFGVADISTVSASTLNPYDVVILGEMPVTAAQATIFTTWVDRGGNLIAMRPAATLAALMGLGGKSSTLSNGYLLVDGSSAPGAGVAADTLQFRGTADQYAIGGAATVATLYSDEGTATSYPAVTVNSVGTNGGQAAAFAYDLARSVVYSRQGDPTLPVEDRDGVGPITSADLLFGAANAGKVAIPQADEQQRLLANLVLRMNRDRKPLPRFWYFPRGTKAVVVMTGERELSDAGEAARLDGYKAASAPGCSVANWECIRATAYLATDTTTFSNASAAAYQADGFELGLQVNTGCANWMPLSLATTYSDQLTAFAAAFPSLQPQKTHRMSCSVWSDYATQPAAEAGRGIRLDLSYSGLSFFTGSGMPMRFADAAGGLIDVYQAATQLDGTLGETDPSAIDALLAKAVGPEGYYGAFVTNMKADWEYSAGSDQIVASARAHGVPVIAARQLVDWIDGRNESSFQALTWTDRTLTFSIAIGSNATGLQAMLPATMTAGSLSALTLNGNPVAFTRETIKGIDYVVFQAAAGTYRAIYVP